MDETSYSTVPNDLRLHRIPSYATVDRRIERRQERISGELGPLTIVDKATSISKNVSVPTVSVGLEGAALSVPRWIGSLRCRLESVRRVYLGMS